MGLKEVVDSSAKYNHGLVRSVTRFALSRDTLVTVTTGRNRLGFKEPVRQLAARIQRQLDAIEPDESYPRREVSLSSVKFQLQYYAIGERRRTRIMNHALNGGGLSGGLGGLALGEEAFGFAALTATTVATIVRGYHADRRKRRFFDAASQFV